MKRVLASCLIAAALGACVSDPAANWQVTGSCPLQDGLGTRSFFGLATTVEVATGKYVGTIATSLGAEARFAAELDGSGKTMTLMTEWLGFGPSKAVLTYDNQAKAFIGTNSLGCDVKATRS